MIRVSTLAMTVVLVLFGASACGCDDGPAPAVGANGPGTVDRRVLATRPPCPSQTCSDLLDDDVVAAFGLAMSAAAGETSGRCERADRRRRAHRG